MLSMPSHLDKDDAVSSAKLLTGHLKDNVCCFSAFFPLRRIHNYPSDSQHERESTQTWKECYILDALLCKPV